MRYAIHRGCQKDLQSHTHTLVCAVSRLPHMLPTACARTHTLHERQEHTGMIWSTQISINAPTGSQLRQRKLRRCPISRQYTLQLPPRWKEDGGRIVNTGRAQITRSAF